jgi:tRNA pseudouridine38-40 synthase
VEAPLDPAPPRLTWRLDLAWDGRGLVGWQRQLNGPSVQQTVEEALGRLLGEPELRVRAAGRTDAGVHALHQVTAFETAVRREPARLKAGLNHLLPRGIACLEVGPAPPGFDPRGWTTSKLYRYRILSRQARCPFREGLCWHLARPLDVEAMRLAAARLVGRQDFRSFQARGCGAEHSVRLLQSLSLSEQPDELWLEFEGHGFLRHQVRIMTGTLVEVGLGRRPEAWVSEVVQARHRDAAGETAPAHGLWLVEVRIGDGPRPRSGEGLPTGGGDAQPSSSTSSSPRSAGVASSSSSSSEGASSSSRSSL